MNFASRPYVRVSLLFILGLLIGGEITTAWWQIGIVLLTITGWYVIQNSRSTWKSGITVHILFLSCILLFGIFYIRLFDRITEAKLSYFTDKKSTYTGILTESLKCGERQRWIVTLEQDSTPSITVLAIMPKHLSLDLSVGTKVSFDGKLTSVPPPSNPNTFDYQAFLYHQNITKQIFINDSSVYIVSRNHINPFRQIALRATHFIEGIFDTHFHFNETKGLAKAIFIGNKKTLDEDIKQDFIMTGAAHVLSVSGLHVGVFIGMFVWLFDVYKTRSLFWRKLQPPILLSLIGFYVIMTGAAPSVIRSGLMIALYLVGKYTAKSSDTFNILSIVGIGMLLYNPHYIFQPSFQFSFAALASILFFYPYVEKWYHPRSYIDGFIWSLMSVTLAAQPFTLPISIFYFHKLPTYFILSGLVMVPLTSLVIYGCVFMVGIQMLMPQLNNFLGQILEFLLRMMIGFSDILAKLPLSTLDNLYLTKFEIILLAIILLLAVWLIGHYQKSVLVVLLASIFIFGAARSHHSITKKNQQYLTIYSLPSGWSLDIFIGTTCLNFDKTEISAKALGYAQESHRTKNAINDIKKLTSHEIISINNLSILQLDKNLNIKSLDSCYNVDILIIDDAYMAFPTLILNNIAPKNVILTPETSLKMRRAWANSGPLISGKIHNLKKDGAFMLSF
ncbi:MAG: ComEC/Rec2 family competence protein [Saprospiraceae bacterium]